MLSQEEINFTESSPSPFQVVTRLTDKLGMMITRSSQGSRGQDLLFMLSEKNFVVVSHPIPALPHSSSDRPTSYER